MKMFNSLKHRIMLYAVTSALVLIAVGLQRHYHPPAKIGTWSWLEENPLPLGNSLSSYFYYISVAPDEEILQRHNSRLRVEFQPDLAIFYKKLNWDLRLNNIKLKSDAAATWNQMDIEGNKKPMFMQYWQNLRPLMQEFFANALPPIMANMPVVHFRCSDVPFVKHEQYHLPKVSSVLWMIQQIKQRGYDQIIFLNCNNHVCLDQGACPKYVDFYKQIFVRQNIQVHVRCDNVIEDFAMMVNSPLLISLNASSYSFMAGVAKDPHNYISANMGTEVNGHYILQTDVDWIIDPNPPLLHRDVQLYADTDSVFAQLNDLQ